MKEYPKQAMSFNGVYLEDVIPGYRTEAVSGREELQFEVNSKVIGQTDGSNFQNRRQPSRNLKVGFRLYCTVAHPFWSSYNKLKGVTNKEDVKIVFRDEPDKYYIGSSCRLSIKGQRDGAVMGQLEIFCADPLKYATTLKSATARVVNKNGKAVYMAQISNNGTAKAPIDYKIQCKSSMAYIGIASEHGVMQFGSTDPDSTERGAETLLTWTGMSNGFVNLAQAGELNKRHPNGDIPTALSLKVIDDTRYGWSKSVVLDLENGAQAAIDTSGNRNAVCGTLTARIPEDSRSERGAKNFYCSMNHTFADGDVRQTGWLAVSFLDQNKGYVCGYEIVKSSMTENKAEYLCVYADTRDRNNPQKVYKKMTFAPMIWDDYNPLNPPRGPNDLLKEGGKIRFHMWGKYYTLNAPWLANTEVHYVQIAIGQSTRWGDWLTQRQATLRKQQSDYEAAKEAYDALDSNDRKGKKAPVDPKANQDPDWDKSAIDKCREMLMPEMAVRNLRFDKLCVEYKKTHLKFAAGDVLQIKGETCKFYLNNVYKPEQEALGTEYFKAPPGETTIEFQVPANAIRPDITISWREAWL